MESRGFKELFRDFISLSYVESPRPKEVRDISVDNLIIARIESGTCKIYYLFNGSHILIPFDILDLISCFNIWNTMSLIKPKDEIESIGYFLTELCICLDKGLSIPSGDKIINSISGIAKIGYSRFTEYIRIEYNKILDPIEYVTLTDIIEL